MSSRDTTPKYVVKISVPGWAYTPEAWNCRRDGRPTRANLAKYVRDFEASTAPGGCNAHLGQVRVDSARIAFNYAEGLAVAVYHHECIPSARVPAACFICGHRSWKL